MQCQSKIALEDAIKKIKDYIYNYVNKIRSDEDKNNRLPPSAPFGKKYTVRKIPAKEFKPDDNWITEHLPGISKDEEFVTIFRYACAELFQERLLDCDVEPEHYFVPSRSVSGHY